MGRVLVDTRLAGVKTRAAYGTGPSSAAVAMEAGYTGGLGGVAA